MIRRALEAVAVPAIILVVIVLSLLLGTLTGPSPVAM